MDNFFIKEEINFESIESTQLYARKYIEEKHPQHITLIKADHQTNGIGRYDRKWVSPKGVNIYTTIIIPCIMNKIISLLPFLPTIVCCSVSQTLEIFGFHPKIKWVNDVLLDDGKKVSGTIIECQQEGDSAYILIGIGINVNMGEEDLKEIDQKATSLKLIGGKEYNKDNILSILVKKLGENFIKKSDLLIEYANSRLAFKNQNVKILDKNNNSEIGCVKELDENGFLLLIREDGSVKTFYDGRLFLIE